MVWTEAHTALDEKANMTPEIRQVAWASDKADELAKTGAIEDGAGMAELLAKESPDSRKNAWCLQFQNGSQKIVKGIKMLSCAGGETHVWEDTPCSV